MLYDAVHFLCDAVPLLGSAVPLLCDAKSGWWIRSIIASRHEWSGAPIPPQLLFLAHSHLKHMQATPAYSVNVLTDDSTHTHTRTHTHTHRQTHTHTHTHIHTQIRTQARIRDRTRNSPPVGARRSFRRRAGLHFSFRRPCTYIMLCRLSMAQSVLGNVRMRCERSRVAICIKNSTRH
jgi:hypothetical protein